MGKVLNLLVILILCAVIVNAQADFQKKLEKKFGKEQKDKKMKAKLAGVKVYHHVHSSLDDAENLKKKEHVSKDALKLKDGKGIKRMQHYDSELKEVTAKPNVDAGKSEIEQKYKKVLDLAKKEKKIADGETDKDESDLGMLKNVEKVAEKRAMKTHRVKTSDRMLASMKHLLMKLNGGKIEGADQYNMKRFVSNIFNRYKFNNEVQQERKRRILALEDHMQKRHDHLLHRPNFQDEFNDPHEGGFDPYTYIPVAEMKKVRVAHPKYPTQFRKEKGKIKAIPEPPEMRLSPYAKSHIVGSGDIYYTQESPKMNMPLVAPPAIPSSVTIPVQANGEELPKGLIPRTWYRVKNYLF